MPGERIERQNLAAFLRSRPSGSMILYFGCVNPTAGPEFRAPLIRTFDRRQLFGPNAWLKKRSAKHPTHFRRLRKDDFPRRSGRDLGPHR